jgi:hypothetical protein
MGHGDPSCCTKFNKNSVVFIAGIFAVCLISIIAMSWDEIKHLFKKKKTH